MSLYCATGSAETDLTARELQRLLAESLDKLGARSRVISARRVVRSLVIEAVAVSFRSGVVVWVISQARVARRVGSWSVLTRPRARCRLLTRSEV